MQITIDCYVWYEWAVCNPCLIWVCLIGNVEVGQLRSDMIYKPNTYSWKWSVCLPICIRFVKINGDKSNIKLNIIHTL
jgi:hypothetical protein